MKPNAAIAFLLCGSAMMLLQRPNRKTALLAQVCGVAAAGLGVLTLTEYLTGWNLGIDELLFPDRGAIANLHPGRMAPNTAGVFVVIGLAVWLMGRPTGNPRRPAILAILGSIVSLTGLLAILGYLSRISTGYRWWSQTAMAVPAAGLFLILGLGFLICAWRETGSRWLIGRTLTVGFAGGLALLALVSAYGHRSTTELVNAAALAERTQEVIAKIREIRADMAASQRDLRSYVLTGDNMFLRLTEEATGGARDSLAELRGFTEESPAQQKRLAHLKFLLTELQEFSQHIVELRQAGDHGAAVREIDSDRGKSLNKQIQAARAGMEAEENRRLLLQDADVRRISLRTLGILPAVGVVSLLLITLGLLRLNSEMATHQRFAEALQQSEHRLRLALDGAQIGDWELNLATHAVRHSPRYDQIFGFHHNLPRWNYELFLKQVHPEHREMVDSSFHASVSEGRDWVFECRIIRVDGSAGWIWGYGRVLKDHTGRQVEMLGMVGDITARKQAEEEIRQLNASLEQRVRERTAELEAAVQELDAFSYSVSHDLRAPLRAVDGFARIVMEDYAPQLDDEGRRKLGVIRDETRRMGRLIDDLLAFSRLGRQKMDPAPIDMRTMAQTVFAEIAALEQDRRLQLDLGMLAPARGVAAMIRQVWVNLIGNAVKFTKNREVAQIKIGSRESTDGRQTVYYVQDNGAGFDMRFSDKLFGVFQRLHNAEEFPGTGVGLALAQRIVQRHGGHIWAEGTPGQGATFFFTLPEKNHDQPG
jgi:PAS domain S-box-containing protein